MKKWPLKWDLKGKSLLLISLGDINPLSQLQSSSFYAFSPAKSLPHAVTISYDDLCSPAQLLAFAPGKEQAAGVWEP